MKCEMFMLKEPEDTSQSTQLIYSTRWTHASTQLQSLHKTNSRIYLLRQVIERNIRGGIEVRERRGRRRRKLLSDLKKRRILTPEEGSSYRTMYRARFGRGFGPVVRETTK
jgi:hypothetical protein